MKDQRILVPIDFSALSRQIVEYAAIVARALHASITLLYVCEPPDLMYGIVPGADASQDLELERMSGLTNMQAFIQGAGCLNGIPLISRVEFGYPTSGILEQARIHDVDLIMMGTHGRAGLDRWLMGSVAQGVMSKATCPVLILHRPRPSLEHGTRTRR